MIKKKAIAKTALISSTIGLMAVGIFSSLSPNPIIPSMENFRGRQARLPHSPDSLHPLRSNKFRIGHETTQSQLWSSVHFPTDNYEGQELGRKISDWVVKKIKN